MTSPAAWLGHDSFAIGDTEYVCRPLNDRFPSTAERMCLVKAPWQVESFEQLLRGAAPQLMVEIGMWDGASLALAAELAHPRRIVGIDKRTTESAALRDFIARRHLQQNLRPYFGVDQTDTARLGEILDAEFGSDPLDLVVDDGSHFLDATRTTFNFLFPRLRPAGLYVIEDWATHQWPGWASPLALFVLELVLASEEAPTVVESVTIERGYATVTRGNAALVSDCFDVSSGYGDEARSFLARYADQGAR